jgi:hypothetical protein
VAPGGRFGRCAKFCEKAKADAAILTKNTGRTIRTLMVIPLLGWIPDFLMGKHYL